MIYNILVNEDKSATIKTGKAVRLGRLFENSEPVKADNSKSTEETTQEQTKETNNTETVKTETTGKEGQATETQGTDKTENTLATGATTIAQSQNTAQGTLTTPPEQMKIPSKAQEVTEEPKRSIYPSDKLGRVFGVINDNIEFGLVSKLAIGIDELKAKIMEKLPDFMNDILVYEIGETYPYYAIKYFVDNQYELYDFFSDLIVSTPNLNEVIIYSSSDAELPYAYLDTITDTGNTALVL